MKLALVYDKQTRRTVDTVTGASLKTFMRMREYHEFIFEVNDKTFLVTGNKYFGGPIIQVAVSGFNELLEWPERITQEYDEDIGISREYYEGTSTKADYKPFEKVATMLFQEHIKSAKPVEVSFTDINEDRKESMES